MKPSLPFFLLALPFVALSAAVPVSVDANVAALTKGVQLIGSPGSPGRVCVFGDGAFPVVVGRVDKVVQPVIAAAQWEKGRVVAFGHTGYLEAAEWRDATMGRFLANCILWAAHGAAKPKVVVLGGREVGEGLAAMGFDTASADLKKLAPAQVLVAAGRIEAGDVAAITRFIRAGGGFIAAGTGWGWKQLNPGKSLATDFAVNRVLYGAGLLLADGSASDTAPGGFSVGGELSPLLHAGRALAAAGAQPAGGAGLGNAGLALASATLLGALDSLPADDPLFLPRLRAMAAAALVVPSPQAPVQVQDLTGRLAARMQGQEFEQLAPEKTPAHPAAANFPGAVAKGAPRLQGAPISVDTKIPGWHSTGLYAAPGEVIALTIPAAAVQKKLRIRIGAHRDELWHLDSWKRFPEITREVPIEAATTRVACAFGGLVYVVVPAGSDAGVVAATISNAVAAPLYIHGQTSLEKWRTDIRNAPAPWGEIATAKVIVTLPSAVLRKLDDPKALMDVWDRVLDLEADLATISRDRPRPERIVCDEQISAGYMHSGYPIMTWMDQTGKFADRDDLLKGNWGIFHELGHNHQVSDWTFEGTTEVTCNLFSLYVSEKMCGVKPRDYAHGGSKTPVLDLSRKYLSAPTPNFERWKAEPFTALSMYIQMQDAFGWEAFQKVFAEYRALPKEQRPKTNADKHDQWMTRFSRAAGKNLAPFFRNWGVPVSDEAVKSIASLPPWMPEGMSAR